MYKLCGRTAGSLSFRSIGPVLPCRSSSQKQGQRGPDITHDLPQKQVAASNLAVSAVGQLRQVVDMLIPQA